MKQGTSLTSLSSYKLNWNLVTQNLPMTLKNHFLLHIYFKHHKLHTLKIHGSDFPTPRRSCNFHHWSQNMFVSPPRTPIPTGIIHSSLPPGPRPQELTLLSVFRDLHGFWRVLGWHCLATSSFLANSPSESRSNPPPSPGPDGPLNKYKEHTSRGS